MIPPDAWGPVHVVGRLPSRRNEVYELRRAGERLVARATRRTPEQLDWELDLMAHLTAHDLAVPRTVPTDDGRRHVDGVVVQRWVPGHPPTGYDWPAVAAVLRHLHELTPDWPQRPGFASTRDLLTEDRGGDVDLTVMPDPAVTACRAAWQALDGPHTVVHGDPAESNILVTEHGITLIDWDESRVDHPHLDLADLPDHDLGPHNRPARAATTAWETAAGWTIEPTYARDRLTELLAN